MADTVFGLLDRGFRIKRRSDQRQREANEAEVRSQSYQHRMPVGGICGVRPDECEPCESCGRPFCVTHRSWLDGETVCFVCHQNLEKLQ